MCETVESFIRRNQKIFPKAEESILRFIADVIFHNGTEKEKTEDIRRLFADGYCYYFALMLQDAFPGGTICWAAPFGHIVYEYHHVHYDIDGVYSGEANSLIPVERLGEAINDFRHIPGREYNATEQELAEIQLDWEEEQNKGKNKEDNQMENLDYKEAIEIISELGVSPVDMLSKIITSMKYSDLKDKIIGILANVKYAKERELLFKELPGTDIGITYAIKIKKQGDKIFRLRLKDNILYAWDISLEEVNRAAFKNMEANLDVDILEMWPLTAVSNSNKSGGVINILLPKVQEMIKNKVGEEFYILPSSIHECLICSKGIMTVEDMLKMVKDNNQREDIIRKEEVLSNDVFEMDEHGNLISARKHVTK